MYNITSIIVFVVLIVLNDIMWFKLGKAAGIKEAAASFEGLKELFGDLSHITLADILKGINGEAEFEKEPKTGKECCQKNERQTADCEWGTST